MYSPQSEEVRISVISYKYMQECNPGVYITRETNAYLNSVRLHSKRYRGKLIPPAQIVVTVGHTTRQVSLALHSGFPAPAFTSAHFLQLIATCSTQ